MNILLLVGGAASGLALVYILLQRYVRAGGGADDRVGLVHWVVILSWSCSVLPGFVDVLMHGRHQKSLYAASIYGASSEAAIVSSLLSALLALICALAVIGGLRHQPSANTRNLMAFLLPWLFIGVISAVHAGNGIQKQVVMYPLVAMAVWLMQPDFSRIMLLLGRLTVLTAALSLLLILVRPQAAFFVNSAGGGPGKGIVDGELLLAGMYTHPNQLGTVLALGVPFLFLFGKVGQVFAFPTVFAALLWSGSRTSLVAAVVCVVMTLVVSRMKRRTNLLSAAICTAATLAILTPFLAQSASAFSGRGRIWAASFAHLPDHWLLGGGPDFYRSQFGYTTDFGRYGAHGHNVFINVLSTGGLVGCLALFVFTIFLYSRARHLSRLTIVPLSYLLSLTTISWLEVPFDFSRVGVNGYVVWLPLALIAFGRQLDTALTVKTASLRRTAQDVKLPSPPGRL